MPSLLHRKQDKYSLNNIFQNGHVHPPWLLIDNYVLLSDYQTAFSNKRNTMTSNHVPLLIALQTGREDVNISTSLDETTNINKMSTELFAKYLKDLIHFKFGSGFANKLTNYYLSSSELHNDVGNVITGSDNNEIEYVVDGNGDVEDDDIDDGEDMDDSDIENNFSFSNEKLLSKLIFDMKLICPSILLAKSIS